MTCRNCGANLEAARIERSLGIVTCAHCGSLHELARRTSGGGAAGATSRDPDAHGAGAADEGTGPAADPGAAVRGPTPVPVSMPSSFDVRRGEGSLQVRWPKGRKAGAVVLFLIGLGWGGAAASSGLIFLVPVALAILYAAVVRGVNRTTLRVDGSRVRVMQGPLPWPGARDVARGRHRAAVRERAHPARPHGFRQRAAHRGTARVPAPLEGAGRARTHVDRRVAEARVRAVAGARGRVGARDRERAGGGRVPLIAGSNEPAEPSARAGQPNGTCTTMPVTLSVPPRRSASATSASSA